MTYEFDIDYKQVNLTGKFVQAMTINDQLPAPTISATVGDTLEVTFNNRMDVETSIHWHGILLPNDQDGVSYVTNLPILPDTSFTYRYPVIHAGTYWYHAHTDLQEQRGLYGALVFHPSKSNVKVDHDQVLVFSDWTNENPSQVWRNLKKSDHYYALKKDSVVSWDKVIAAGSAAIKNKLESSWMRMGPMDISDIGYDAFLVNGAREQHLPYVEPNQLVRLRLVNASASTYFNIEFADGPMQIISADGVDVELLTVQRLRMAIAETYDLLICITDAQSYELRATSEDGTGSSSVWIGSGPKVYAPTIAKPNFLLGHSGHGDGHHQSGADHTMHSMHAMGDQAKDLVVPHLTQYQGLRSPTKTTIDQSRPVREVPLRLTGNMERFVWSFNNKTLTQQDTIAIKKGEKVRFVLQNETMMHHPIHLHGHFFRVLNGEGDYSPLKHTVNVPALETVIIEFAADEEKDWLFHCHNLYHMKSGMTRVVRYQGHTKDPALMAAAKNNPWPKDNAWFIKGELAALSSHSKLHWRPWNIDYAFDVEIEHDYDRDYEAEARFERHISRFVDVYVGVDAEQEENEHEEIATAGIRYMLPLLIQSDWRIDSDGRAQLELSSELQLTKRWHTEWEYNTDDEYSVFLNYEFNKQWLFSINSHDDFAGGVGFTRQF
ncbi:MAG: multicopper oxidase domain-containing protein [Gammaproteobacteria bacterium]|nr:multicopper oxidase domain-containing protein [Gammaproteobacteria bacterium]